MKINKRLLIISSAALVAVPVGASAEVMDSTTPVTDQAEETVDGLIEINPIDSKLPTNSKNDKETLNEEKLVEEPVLTVPVLVPVPVPEEELKLTTPVPNPVVPPSSIWVLNSDNVDRYLKDAKTDFDFAYEGIHYSYDYRGRSLVVLKGTESTYTSLNIPNKLGDIPVVEIGDSAFNGILVTQVSIPDSVKKIGKNAFLNSKIRALTLRSGLTEIGSYAFSGNYIQILSLPSTVNKMGEGAFANGTLTSVNLSSSLIEISNKAFMNNSISLLSIPGSTQIIGSEAFAYNSITDLVVMKGLVSIGDSAFAHNKIENVYIPSTVSIVGQLAYFNNPIKSVAIPDKLNFYLHQITTNPNALSNLQVFSDKDDPGSTPTSNKVNNQNSVTQKDVIGMQVQQGSFGIVKPKFASNSFGTFDLGKNELQKELGFASDIYIVDMSGSGKGWSLSVEASQFEEVKPANGGIAPSKGWLKLPKGSVKLTGLGDVYRVNNDGTKTKSEVVKLSSSESPIDNGQVSLLSADNKNSYGAFGVDMSKAKLLLNLDPSTTLVDSDNYPNSATPYTTTVTWTLTSGPGN